MPNHVTTRLTITGSPAVREKLIATIGADHPETPTIAYMGEEVYTKGDDLGWWNRGRGEFMHYGPGIRSHDNRIITKTIPAGWVRHITPAWRQHIDFEKIIPCPSAVLRGNLSLDDMEANLGRNWYAWNMRKWGTKWNAYSTKIDDEGRIVFNTAWSFPEPVLVELSNLFPELTLTCETIDEGGWFWGTAVFEGGKKTLDAIVCESKLATAEQRAEEARLSRELLGEEPSDPDTPT